MVQVSHGRYTEPGEQGVTVFLIGMRFNHWWRVDKWWPVFVAMPRMLRHLEADPTPGLLGWHVWPGRTVLVLQYWRSTEELIAFASDSTAPHAVCLARVQPQDRSGRQCRRLARDLRGPGGPRRGHLRQDAALRPRCRTRHVPVGPGRGSARARLHRRGS